MAAMILLTVAPGPVIFIWTQNKQPKTMRMTITLSRRPITACTSYAKKQSELEEITKRSFPKIFPPHWLGSGALSLWHTKNSRD